MTIKKIILGTTALLAGAMLATSAQAANLITNGSFETGDLTGWTSTYGSYNPFGTSYGAGMDGTHWAWIAGYETPITLSQTVTGLTVGQKYSLTFITASEYTHADQLRVSINGGAGTLFTAPAYTAGGAGSFWNNWAAQGMTFTATGTSATIAFDTNGLNQGGYDVGLDKVSLTSAAPEPASWALLATGFGLVGAGLRRQQRRTRVVAA